jgi:hypothetical protein
VLANIAGAKFLFITLSGPKKEEKNNKSLLAKNLSKHTFVCHLDQRK